MANTLRPVLWLAALFFCFVLVGTIALFQANLAN
jgi:hypothetical protein